MGRDNNYLQIWGNKESMNLNPMILTNIQSSTYFKQKLFELKTYHEVIDEIYYRVNHLEPWEKGSRRTQGLTGMCGGVRGVGGGGIVSSAYCLLYKLYTLKLTRKQVIGLITHKDSPYIRGLGLMYIRYTQNPQDLYSWYEDYLDDEEEVDVKAGGGMVMTIGQIVRQWLIRLEWFDTLFPRIPVPIQKEIMDALRDRYGNRVDSNAFYEGGTSRGQKRSPPPEVVEALRDDRKKQRASRSRSRSESRERDRSRTRHRSRSRDRSRERSRERSRDRSGSRRQRKEKEEKRRHHSRSRSRSKDSSERRHRHHKHHKHSKHHKSHRHEDHDSERDEARSSKSRSGRKRSDERSDVE